MKKLSRRNPDSVPGTSTDSSTIYLNVAIFLVVLIGVNFFIALILQTYFNESVLSNMSYIASDPSWVPTDTSFPAALGQHYFGDFEQYVGYAKSSLPAFTLPDTHTSAYGPLAIVLAKAFNGMFGWPREVFVFLLASTALFFVSLVSIIGRSREKILVALLLLISGPVIVTLDRGNLQILMAGLFGLFCVGILKEHWKLVVICLSMAIAIKAYAALFLLILIKQKRWRDVVLTVGLTFILFVVSFLLIPGSLFTNFRGFLQTNLSFAGGVGDIANFVSATGLIFKYLLLAWGPTRADIFVNEFPGWAFQIPGLIIACLCIAILWFSKEKKELGLIALLALIQLAPIASGSYLELNIIIELCLLLRLLTGPHFSLAIFLDSASASQSVGKRQYARTRRDRQLLSTAAFLLAVGVAPWVFRFGSLPSLVTTAGKTTSATGAWVIIGPTANVLCLICIALVTSRSRARSEKTHLHA